jgi:DNA-directed RNA polymerase specialized sigma24 family protein
VRLARSKLIRMGCSRVIEDEEDVALSAIESVCRGLEQGRFPQLADRDGLWRLLVWTTVRKSIDLCRKRARSRTHGANIFAETDLVADAEQHSSRVLDRMASDDTPPDLAVIVAEQFHKRIESLGEQTLIRIVELKKENFTNQQIADQLRCSLRTVTLKLERIRMQWSPESPPRVRPRSVALTRRRESLSA